MAIFGIQRCWVGILLSKSILKERPFMQVTRKSPYPQLPENSALSRAEKNILGELSVYKKDVSVRMELLQDVPETNSGLIFIKKSLPRLFKIRAAIPMSFIENHGDDWDYSPEKTKTLTNRLVRKGYLQKMEENGQTLFYIAKKYRSLAEQILENL
ncbi:MAG: hypothetical protein VKJ06_02310 [Vampirovibrionales bacterium]|nr:hypothetical protein [Vampirovibrionales bacterium]